MADEVDKIKEKLDIVDVVSSYINLNKSGKNFKGLCPFHQEKDPSLVVSPNRNIWHCFGCGKGGDLIEFVKLYEGMEFPEALRLLAKRADIPIEDISQKEQKQLSKLYKINDEARKFYFKKLKENKEVLKYLIKDRGLEKETIEEFKLGFAPGGDELTVYLLDKGFDIKNILKSGLAHKKSSGLKKDRFSQRIVFPIINEIDRTIAFTGRLFDPDGKREDAPKYLNSPETPVYNKSKVLYGLNKTKKEIVNSKTVFLVEGQMDFLMMYQAGVKNVVAVSGTGLSEQHLDKLSRLADRIVVSFDNDRGGVRALERGLDMFSKVDLHVKVLDLGKFEDPAQAVQEDLEFFKEAVENVKPAFQYLFEHYFEEQSGDMVDKKKTVRHLLEKLSKLESSVEQDMWLEKLSDYSGISPPALRNELEKVSSADSSSKNSQTQDGEDTEQEKTRRNKISKRLLLLGFTDDDFWSIIEDNREWFPKKYQKIIDNPDSSDYAQLELKSSHEASGKSREEIEREIEDLMRNLKIEGLKKKRDLIKKKMRSSSKEEKTQDLADRFHKISQKIDKLKN